MHRALATDSAAATQFLQTAFSPDDWVALFLKSHANGQVAQRVGSVQWAASPSTQTWLHQMNSRGFDVYVSVNAIAAGRRSRARDAIASVRHVFLEVDRDGDATLASVEGRSDLPSPSYVLHSSPGRLHLFWRATGFEKAYVERLQKQLALELSTDTAATPATQTTRLPGFFNRKRAELHLVTIDYRDVHARYGPADFPTVNEMPVWISAKRPHSGHIDVSKVERAKRYLASVPPAVTGQHGDLHTFRVCCRVVRGFALNAEDALDALAEWNARCEPPWSVEELRDKLWRAAQYGREPIGGLL